MHEINFEAQVSNSGFRAQDPAITYHTMDISRSFDTFDTQTFIETPANTNTPSIHDSDNHTSSDDPDTIGSHDSLATTRGSAHSTVVSTHGSMPDLATVQSTPLGSDPGTNEVTTGNNERLPSARYPTPNPPPITAPVDRPTIGDLIRAGNEAGIYHSGRVISNALIREAILAAQDTEPDHNNIPTHTTSTSSNNTNRTYNIHTRAPDIHQPTSGLEQVNRPCVDCGLVTGGWCEGRYGQCPANHWIPTETWRANRSSPLCSKCEEHFLWCHLCRHVTWSRPASRPYGPPNWSTNPGQP